MHNIKTSSTPESIIFQIFMKIREGHYFGGNFVLLLSNMQNGNKESCSHCNLI